MLLAKSPYVFQQRIGSISVLVFLQRKVPASDGRQAGSEFANSIDAVGEFRGSAYDGGDSPFTRTEMKAGLERARAEGKALGRPSKFAEHRASLEAMLEEGLPKAEIKRRTGLAYSRGARNTFAASKKNAAPPRVTAIRSRTPARLRNV